MRLYGHAGQQWNDPLMPFAAEAVLVLIASPGDAALERAAIADELNRWNAARSEREHVVVIPWLYERHAIPLMGDHPQSIINSQAADRADVVVAVFDARLGTATGAAVSGTAEEIDRALTAGKAVHVYFSTEDVPRDRLDPAQLAALAEFRQRLAEGGLLGEYSGPEDVAAQVRSAIEFDIARLGWGTGGRASGASPQVGAILRAKHVSNREPRGTDKRGKVLYRTTENRLIVRNESPTTTAELLRIEVHGVDGSDVEARFDGPTEPFDLPPVSERSWLLIPMGPQDAEVHFTWTEQGEEHSSMQVIVLRTT